MASGKHGKHGAAILAALVGGAVLVVHGRRSIAATERGGRSPEGPPPRPTPAPAIPVVTSNGVPRSPPTRTAPAVPSRGISRDHDAADDATSAVSAAPSTGGVPKMRTGDWAEIIHPLCAQHGIQLPFALSWIDAESGGNPCAVGYPPAKGPDGNPKEMGIAQLYNPDDLDRLGIAGKQLRAYCVPGFNHVYDWRGKKVRGASQDMSRPLTRAEMETQAHGTIGLILESMRSASADLTAVRAGPGWSPRTRSYWRLVKLQHGIPAISREGLPAVTKKLGRAPLHWDEFRTELAGVKLAPRTEQQYRHLFDFALDNAEKTAAAFDEGAGALS